MDVEKSSVNKSVFSEVSPVASRVRCVENLEWLKTLPDGCCDLIYVDPPFFSGKTRTTIKGHSFDDPGTGGVESFVEYLRPRLEEMYRLLRSNGTLWVHLDWRTIHYVKVLLDSICGSRNFLNEIIWSYRTGGRSKQWFGRKHDTILVYARSIGDHTFHVLHDGEFRTEGMNYDEEGRPYKTTKKGRLYFNPAGPAMTDVWEIPFLSTVSRERTGYPTQKPEALLERIVESVTNPGDTVGDFFCGSGTTLAVASRLGRHVLGCDQNPEAIRITLGRLEALQAEAS